ncbi:MAG: chorismate mutase [Candidatus Eremiobacteraeota bacterium]|nr:chorismate mutase [Candidatus Eremiobacteraeota bacterium]
MSGKRQVVRGIRGATTAERDTPDAILDATERLLLAIRERNPFELEDIASALFTVTPDLRSEFPAAAARRIGWKHVPLLNFTEVPVPGMLQRCIRTLIHINTSLAQNEIVHVYLEGAVVLRPDLTRS